MHSVGETDSSTVDPLECCSVGQLADWMAAVKVGRMVPEKAAMSAVQWAMRKAESMGMQMVGLRVATKAVWLADLKVCC